MILSVLSIISQSNPAIPLDTSYLQWLLLLLVLPVFGTLLWEVLSAVWILVRTSRTTMGLRDTSPTKRCRSLSFCFD